MRTSRRHTDTAAPLPTETIHSALAGEPEAVRALLHAGWTLWISPAILQGKRGIVELRHQSAEGRQRHALPVLTFLKLRDEGAITTQPATIDDLWVRCALSERALNASTREATDGTSDDVASSAA